MINYVREMRLRMTYCLGAWILGRVAAFYYRRFFLRLLMKPLESQRISGFSFVFLNLREAFRMYVFLRILVALYVTVPLGCVHLWLFMAPALYKEEQKTLFFLALGSWMLLSLALHSRGAFLFPRAWLFFLTFQGPLERASSLHYMPSLRAYIYFSLTLRGAMVLSSQMPLGIYFLLKNHWISLQSLAQSRRWFYVAIFFWAALVSPPDVLRQLILGFPLLFFYEFLLWFSFVFRRRKPLNFN